MKGKGKDYEYKIIDICFECFFSRKRLNNFIRNITFILIKCLTCFVKCDIIYMKGKGNDMKKVNQALAYEKILELLSHNFGTKAHQLAALEVLKKHLEKD